MCLIMFFFNLDSGHAQLHPWLDSTGNTVVLTQSCNYIQTVKIGDEVNNSISPNFLFSM